MSSRYSSDEKPRERTFQQIREVVFQKMIFILFLVVTQCFAIECYSCLFIQSTNGQGIFLYTFVLIRGIFILLLQLIPLFFINFHVNYLEPKLYLDRKYLAFIIRIMTACNIHCINCIHRLFNKGSASYPNG